MRKGEIACYKQFFPFSLCFSQLYISLVCQRAALCGNGLTLVFTCQQLKSFENTVGKRENACNEQFLLFPTVFSTGLENFQQFSLNFKLSSANSFSLGESKICRLGKG